VLAGPQEATVAGSMLCLLIATGRIGGLEEGRDHTPLQQPRNLSAARALRLGKGLRGLPSPQNLLRETDMLMKTLLSATAFVAALAGSAASPAAAKDVEIVAVVKIAGIPWFNRFKEGVKQAGADLHVKATQAGSAQADPAHQVKIIEDLIAKGVDVIVVVPNDAKVIEPVFERAKAKGIVVITHESSDQKGADWAVETIDNKKFAEEVFQKFADLTGGKGEFGLFVGGLTAPLQNYWADTGLA
jgi:simple sugar transport system substrate-binding protein